MTSFSSLRAISSSTRLYSTNGQRQAVRTVLGIETSCDDTGVAVVTTDRRILAECVYSQWHEHKTLGRPSQRPNSQMTAFRGGITPHLARAMHYKILPQAVSECIEKAADGDWTRIDALAVTVKPGLEPCLWEGINFAKLLLMKHSNLMFVPVHHMQAHALTCRLFDPEIAFPYLTLLISGGHCIVALVRDFDNFEIFGQSLDCSPGNCIDKIARKLGLFELETPTDSKNATSGGSLVEAYASKGDPEPYINIIQMTRNYIAKNRDCDFSFSGILTSLQRLIDRLVLEASDSNSQRTIIVDGVERKLLDEKTISNICAVMQFAIAIQLEDRLKRALVYLKIKELDAKVKHVVVSGGVASNQFIKTRLTKVIEGFPYYKKISFPAPKYCTDNGAMIAWNGCEKLVRAAPDCVPPDKQDKEFFESLKAEGTCDLGDDISFDLRLLDIKLKAKR